MVCMNAFIDHMGMVGINGFYILTNLNHAELLKGRMTIAGNSNLSHLLAQNGSKILTLPIVVVHH